MAEDSLPIDIHYNKLLDWLIDRRHCDIRWHHQLRDIKDKIKHGLVNLPRDVLELKSVFAKEDTTYIDCIDVMEYLKTVESPDKNILGQYSSAKLKEWNDILRSYEKKNLHLAEGAQMMTRLVNYEIASLKRQISRCQQQQRESARKSTESQANAITLQTRFGEQCKELGIKGKDIHNELTHLLSTQLPELFSEVVALMPTLQPTIDYYRAFRSYTISRSSSDNEILFMLTYLITHGNTTVYQWEHGEMPPTVEQESIPQPQQNEDELVIDWGGLANGNKDEGGIDFGEGEIDYDITLDQVDLSGITVEDGGDAITTSLSTKTTYPTLLEDFTTRNLLLDDIMELLEFVKQRVSELSSDAGGLLQVDTQLPSSLQAHSSKDVEEMIGKIMLILDKLTNKRTQQLLLMLGSQSYLDRISSQLLRQQELSQRALSSAIDHTHKIEEASQQQQGLEEELKVLVEKTKRIKELVVEEISKKYNHRTVNIVGDINQI